MCTEYVYFSEHSLAFICVSEITDQAKGSMCQLAWQVGVLVCVCVCVSNIVECRGRVISLCHAAYVVTNVPLPLYIVSQ